MRPTDLPSREHALIAILRGLEPNQANAVGETLHRAGFRMIEVPLNSPDPFASIRALAMSRGEDCLIGAGTVLTVNQVQQAHAAGARLVVAPNCNSAVIAAALRLDMQVMPGFATATEAFSALDAGARHLKLFPAASYGPRHLQALRAVLPPGVGIHPVGGIGAADIPAWLGAGAAGFGFGTELFTPRYTLAEIERRALGLIETYRRASQRSS
jgi:2-dehydro-3-deoxyphosphogalactonate aldolase